MDCATLFKVESIARTDRSIQLSEKVSKLFSAPQLIPIVITLKNTQTHFNSTGTHTTKHAHTSSDQQTHEHAKGSTAHQQMCTLV